MKLWVRSQSKENFLCVKQINYGWSNIKQEHIIYAEDITQILGRYESKKRCLEIIDEIQDILCRSGMILFKDIDITNLSPKDIEPFKAINWCSSPVANEKSEVTVHNAEVVIFQMPKE